MKPSFLLADAHWVLNIRIYSPRTPISLSLEAAPPAPTLLQRLPEVRLRRPALHRFNIRLLEGFEVTIFERDHFPRYHIGESMLPSCRPFMNFIGAEEKVINHGFRVKVF